MSDEKDPVRVGRFEWERLMLMSVPHPTNFKLLPIGVFMSADGGKARPGNAGLAQFGPHEKTWAKLLRWAVAEGWLIQMVRGGARRGPNGTTIVRASVYAASVPQRVWERRMEILGTPPFRAPGFEGSASDPLKGAPETPFNASASSLKGAPGDSLPDSLKGASEVFEGSDPGFEGSVSGFEGSAQALPHHVVTSRNDSSSTSSTTPGAEGSPEANLDNADGTSGGGGGDDSSSQDQEEEQNDRDNRAKSFVNSLDYGGKLLSSKQRQGLTSRITAAFEAGWSERGLRRYLDISDDPNVRTPAAVYAHRLSEKELPAAVADSSLPPACWDCLGKDPAAATDPTLRVNPITCDPCPKCHPAVVGEGSPVEHPPVCAACLEANPASEFNVRFRYRPGADGVMEGCPDCHPKVMALRKVHDGADGGMWDRALDRARQRGATGNWKGAGTDERVAGWMALAGDLAAEEQATSDKRVRQAVNAGRRLQAQADRLAGNPQPLIAPPHQPHRNPGDQSVYEEDFGHAPPTDQSAYDDPI
ncbi:hypothetical protein [Streptomyces sp. KN37]|uniref:hypothetical protein n=1 Tax=Streptomyces sp. KN37 TaxID=3090667 RepID=UPI002A7621AF|nr:hypothetical protein [Streptomyces sp. KN37]WPO69916.1 hypothetical protein R9806_04365 [Streptomyces sp. KN37]